MNDARVVVTGLGMINSLGLNKSDSFKAIINGQCGIKRISCFDVENFPVKIAGEITDFMLKKFLTHAR